MRPRRQARTPSVVVAPGETIELRLEIASREVADWKQQVVGELAPAELGQELASPRGRRGRLSPTAASAACQIWRGPISPKARWGDSREVRGPVGPVAPVGRSRSARSSRNASSARLRAGLAGRPGLPQPAGPVRPGGQQGQAVQRHGAEIGVASLGALQPFHRGERRSGRPDAWAARQNGVKTFIGSPARASPSTVRTAGRR